MAICMHMEKLQAGISKTIFSTIQMPLEMTDIKQSSLRYVTQNSGKWPAGFGDMYESQIATYPLVGLKIYITCILI